MMCLFELHHVIVEVWVELLRDSGRVLPEHRRLQLGQSLQRIVAHAGIGIFEHVDDGTRVTREDRRLQPSQNRQCCPAHFRDRDQCPSAHLRFPTIIRRNFPVLEHDDDGGRVARQLHLAIQLLAHAVQQTQQREVAIAS